MDATAAGVTVVNTVCITAEKSDWLQACAEQDVDAVVADECRIRDRLDDLPEE